MSGKTDVYYLVGFQKYEGQPEKGLKLIANFGEAYRKFLEYAEELRAYEFEFDEVKDHTDHPPFGYEYENENGVVYIQKIY